MSYFISICILIMPWILIPIAGLADQLRLPKAFFFDFICMGIICIGLWEGLKFTYKNKYLSWLSMWILFTMLANWYYPIIFQSHQGMPTYNVWCLDGYLHYIFLLFASMICLSSLEGGDYARISRAICASGIMVTIFGICQIAGFDPLNKIAIYVGRDAVNAPINQNHFSAIIDNPNTVGNYLVLCFPFFLMFKEHKYKFGALFVILGIILSKSSLSIVALAVIMTLWIILRFRSIYPTIISLSSFALFILFAFLNPKFNKLHCGFTGRTEAWGQAIQYIKNNPLFGQGAGITKMLGIKTGAMNWVFAHNDYLELILQFGIIGIFLFALVVIHALRNFNYSKTNIVGLSHLCAFTAFLIIMLGSFPMETAPCALVGMISWWGVEKIV